MNTTLDSVEPERNTPLDTVQPENTTMEIIESEMSTLDIVEPEVNTTLDVVKPVMNTTLDTIEPDMNTPLDTAEPEKNTTMDIVESDLNSALDIVETEMNTTMDIVKPDKHTTMDVEPDKNITMDIVESEMNTTTDIVVEPMINTIMDTEESEINAMIVVSENRELNSTFSFTETVLDSTFAGPTVPDKIEKPCPDTSQHLTSQNCEMNLTSQADVASTFPPVCQEVVEVQNVEKTSSTESTVERVMEDPNIRSDDFVHQRKEFSEVPSVTKIDLNLTFDTYSEQALNISETGAEQTATFKELSDSKGAVEVQNISSEVFVRENCDVPREKSLLKTDLNSTFVTASELPFEVLDSETTQGTTSITGKNIENQMISSTVLVSEGDVLTKDAAGMRTDLNSTFLHESLTKVASPNDHRIEISQSGELLPKGMTDNLNVNNGSFKDTVVHKKQIIHDKSFVNDQCEESILTERDILNAGVLQDSQKVVIKTTNQTSAIEKMKLNLANNLENTQEISKIPDSDEKDNVSTNLSELKSECISSSNDVHSFTPSGIVDGSKQSSDILSHAIFSQNPATKTSNPYADVQSESGRFKKSNGIENIHEQKRGSIEFDANLNNFSITNLDRTNGDLNRIEKLSSVSASEEINIPYVKKESKTSESEFMCIQMTPKNVGTTTLDDQIKELMAKSASLENVSEKRENTSCVKNPQENRHQNVKSNDINSEIQRNLDGICPAVEVIPSQKPNSEEPSTATIDFLDPSANEFFSNGGNEMFQDSNFVFGDEVFKDPSTFDFLTQFGNTTSLRDLRKESLYIKFDPLVGSPRSVTASDKPLPIMNIVREEERSENENINNNADANVEKGEMLNGTCNRNSAGSVESFLRSKSPLWAAKELQDDSTLRKLKEYQEECSSLKAQLAELQETIKTNDKVHKNEISKYTSQIVALDFDLARQEYEKLLSQLVTEKEQNCIEFNQKELKLTKELKECQENLAETEQELSAAQQKCENLQNSMKKHVDTLLVKMKSYEKAVEKEKQKYATLKEHAAEQLERANEKLMAEEERHKLECTKYSSSIANLELQVTNLQNRLDQKTKENETLMAMCNELVERFEH
ncbi:Uncharacterized protein GBIM_05570 [Gryllus bimaculatus]|nr:Uncharacterized protein GBIM_05570 [Gryllus bimaculatus]